MALGYDPSFLGEGYEIPLPTFSDSLLPDVLTVDDIPETEFQDEFYTRYIHYSTATNKARRQPIVVALNIDQELLKPVERGGWTLDDQVGDYQLGGAYYKNNDYDRGHLARRASSAWGETDADAEEASEATMVYSNAALQHAGFNQDEWLHLESWVQRLELDSNNRISVFSGPIYTSRRGIRKSIGDPPAEIPTAFFKVVCFLDSTNECIATRAFIVAQDRDAISDKSARRRHLDLGAYQVPLSVIEEETGLCFSQEVRDGNPLGNLEDTDEPEIFPVTQDTIKTSAGDGASKGGEYPGVFVLAAMPNPKGEDSGNEWLSVGNFGPDELDLEGWKVSAGRRATVDISGIIPSGEARKVTNIEGVRLTNKKGSIALIDPENNIVDRVMYSERSHKVREDVPIMFHLDDSERETGLHN